MGFELGHAVPQFFFDICLMAGRDDPMNRSANDDKGRLSGSPCLSSDKTPIPPGYK